MQSIGNRRIASAVPALKALLTNSDSTLAAASAKALGAIATPKAYAALTAKDTPATAAVWQARLDAARQQPAATVIALTGTSPRAPTCPSGNATRRSFTCSPRSPAED